VAATYIGIAGDAGVLDVIIKAFGQIKSAVHASQHLGGSVDCIMNICQDVKTIVEASKTFNLPFTIVDSIQKNLILVSKVAGKNKKRIHRDRI
jgi:hypothetical protein